MKLSYLGKDTMQTLDEIIINLVGLRIQCVTLPDDIIHEILNRAKHDLIFITEGFLYGIK